ncbi:MAG TPA: NAD(P)H-dependent oxidoreductase subunit E [bacterium]|nr:NAD(P)H-dependent oxidoreductase subunit E [bacterium]
MDLTAVDRICENYSGKPEQLIGILQDVQRECNYLPREALERVGDRMGIPLSRVYAVATFFKAFSLEPRGKNHICVCMGTACHVRGAPKVLSEIEREIGVKAGETDKDLKYTLETVNCVGACALGPVVVANGEYHGKLDTQKVKKMVESLKK